jgi:hypothetical protein
MSGKGAGLSSVAAFYVHPHQRIVGVGSKLKALVRARIYWTTPHRSAQMKGSREDRYEPRVEFRDKG